jgi:hypothetical protein
MQPTANRSNAAAARPPSSAPARPAPRAAATLDWLYHHLTASGPDATLDDFAAAARGAGVGQTLPDQFGRPRLAHFRRSVMPQCAASCRTVAKWFLLNLRGSSSICVVALAVSRTAEYDLSRRQCWFVDER